MTPDHLRSFSKDIFLLTQLAGTPAITYILFPVISCKLLWPRYTQLSLEELQWNLSKLYNFEAAKLY